jgi:hypothetical protein
MLGEFLEKHELPLKMLRKPWKKAIFLENYPVISKNVQT